MEFTVGGVMNGERGIEVSFIQGPTETDLVVERQSEAHY